MTGLSQDTAQITDIFFAAEHREDARSLLIDECGNNLPFMETHDEIELERIRFAVVRPSEGNVDRLITAIDAAQKDWRDALVWAGFGDVRSNKAWARAILSDVEIDNAITAFDCPNYGASEWMQVIRGSSYCLVCGRCHTLGPVTSFLSVAPQLTGIYEVAVVNEDWKVSNRDGIGTIDELQPTIERIQSLGNIIWLQPIGPGSTSTRLRTE